MARTKSSKENEAVDITIKESFYKLEAFQATLYAAGEKGLKVSELAKKLDVSSKTIKRWLDSVEKNNIFAFWYDEDEGTCGVMMDQYLPPFNLKTTQALYIFLACRLLINSYNRYDPELSSLFYQLSNSLPETIRKEVDKTLQLCLEMPRNPSLVHNTELLANAWFKGKSAEITYKSATSGDSVTKRTIDVYFMQPSHKTTYIIAFCHLANDIRIFKSERIETVTILKDEYTIPESFNADSYLSNAWGIMREKPEFVKIRVYKEAVPFITETLWHKSQTTTSENEDVILTFNVGITSELINWIMQWGELVEVLEPTHLRNTIKEKIKKLSEIYR